MRKKRFDLRASAEDCLLVLAATKSKGTVRMYGYALHQFIRKAISEGLRFVDELTIDDFVGYAGDLASRRLAPSTRRVYLSGVTYYMNWIITMGYWEASIAHMKRFENASQQWVGRPVSVKPMVPPEDIEKVIETARSLVTDSVTSQRNLAIVLLLYSSGMRVGELVNLKMEDFIFTARSVRIQHGKGDKYRITFFSPEASLWIQKYWYLRGIPYPDSYVLGQPAFPLTTSSVRRIVSKLVEQTDFKPGYITPHTFRHAFAIKMLQKTGNLALIQDLLGHSSPATTRIYAKYATESLHKLHQEVWE